MEALFLLSRVFVWIVAIIILIISLPYNPLSFNNLKFESSIQSVMPEGWAFFTRNPKEPEIIIMIKSNGIWKSNPLTPLSKPYNYFGLSRLVRAQSVEMAMLFDQIKNSKWNVSNTGFFSVISDTTKVTKVNNISPNPILKDTICLISYNPVPWAWSRFKKNEDMPCKFIVLNVLCSGKNNY